MICILVSLDMDVCIFMFDLCFSSYQNRFIYVYCISTMNHKYCYSHTTQISRIWCIIGGVPFWVILVKHAGLKTRKWFQSASRFKWWKCTHLELYWGSWRSSNGVGWCTPESCQFFAQYPMMGKWWCPGTMFCCHWKIGVDIRCAPLHMSRADSPWVEQRFPPDERNHGFQAFPGATRSIVSLEILEI